MQARVSRSAIGSPFQRYEHPRRRRRRVIPGVCQSDRRRRVTTKVFPEHASLTRPTRQCSPSCRKSLGAPGRTGAGVPSRAMGGLAERRERTDDGDGRSMGLKVVQWATGPVGREALRGILEHPDLDLVGVVVYSAEKDEVDAGDLCGLPPTGVRAHHRPRHRPGRRGRRRLLRPTYPRPRPGLRAPGRWTERDRHPVPLLPSRLRARIRRATDRGVRPRGTSVHGTGINPGFVGDLLVLVSTGLLQSLDHISVHEVGDWSWLESHAMVFDNARFGSPPDDARVDANPYATTMSGYFTESLHMVAAGLGIELDRVTTDQDLLVAEEPIEILSGTIEAGTVRGQHFHWAAVAADHELLTVDASSWVERIDDRRPTPPDDPDGLDPIRHRGIAIDAAQPAHPGQVWYATAPRSDQGPVFDAALRRDGPCMRVHAIPAVSAATPGRPDRSSTCRSSPVGASAVVERGGRRAP